MRNAKGGHLFRLSLILVGLLGLSLMTDMPVPTENADAWPRHECCVDEVRVWIPYENTIWGAIKSEHESGGYWDTWCRRSKPKWHWKGWYHSSSEDPC